MLSAMNTGHDGSLSTGHSNSCKDMLSRIETMVLMGQELPIIAIRQQIASGIDIIIQLGRLRDKSRRVLEIAEVDGMENGEVKLNTIFRFVEEPGGVGRVRGKLVKTGRLKHREKLAAAGMKLKDEDK